MITDRQIKILSAIINDFIQSATPVGSRTISKKYLVGVSSATIRNEMADLEELGYLFSPHTSSGRIPSELGLRFFVERIAQFKDFGNINLDFTSPAFKGRPKLLSEKAAESLSRQTASLVVVEIPTLHKVLLSKILLVKISESKVLMILVSKADEVHTLELRLKNAHSEILDEIANHLTKQLFNSPMDSIDLRSIAKALLEYDGNLDYFISSLKEAFSYVRNNPVAISGLSNLINYISHEDFGILTDLMNNPNQIEELISKIRENDTTSILIGSEIGNKAFSNLSIIAHPYKVLASKHLVIAVTPKITDYEAVVSNVRATAKALEEVYSVITL